MTPEARARREAELTKLPGYQLQKVIAERLGQKVVPGCGCKSMVAEMNRWGIEGCKNPENFKKIVGRLVEVATKKDWIIELEEGEDVPTESLGKPVPQTLTTKMARLACRAAAKTEVGKRVVANFCRRMVELAIKRAALARCTSQDAGSVPRVCCNTQLGHYLKNAHPERGRDSGWASK